MDEATFSCTILKKNGSSPKKFFFLVGFVIPCLVIIISYSCIYWTVRRQRMKLMAHSSAKESNGSSAREREDSRLTAMMLLIFLGFLICFLPLMLVNVADDETKYPILNIIASIFAWASSVVNPFIYAASNRSYRVAFFNLFSALKFFGAPLTPMASKNSRDLSGINNSSGAVKTKPSVLDIKNGVLTHL